MSYSIIWQRNKFIVAGNRECEETDSINFVQSSLKSHPLWETLYVIVTVVKSKSQFGRPRPPTLLVQIT